MYFGTLTYVVFFARRRDQADVAEMREHMNFVPLKNKFDEWYYGYSHNLSSLYLDVWGNLLMFVPFPLFLYIVFGVRSYRKLFLAGFFSSLFIEVTQYFTGVGVPDIDDLILNTTGGLLGIIIIHALKQVVLKDLKQASLISP